MIKTKFLIIVILATLLSNASLATRNHLRKKKAENQEQAISINEPSNRELLFEKGRFYLTAAENEHKSEQKSRLYEQAEDFLTKAANQGHIEASFNLALMYYRGNGVERDVGYAFTRFIRAASQSHSRSQYFVGKLYCVGEGIEQNIPEGIKWYQRAAEQGDAEAQLELGNIYSNHWSKFKDEGLATQYYYRAAKQGNTGALNALGRVGSAQASFFLGEIYYCGYGVSKDDWWAYQHYEDAARAGHQGAWKFIEQKARSNDPRAQVLLGKLIFHRNPQQAIFLYKKAAQRNNHEAEFLLGEIYETGRGGQKNIIEALSWYAKAAPDYYVAKHRIYTIAGRGGPEGHPEAQFIMGWLDYLNPNKDKREAANWFKKAAQRGHFEALFLLGTMCMKGEGVDQSPILSVFYWEKAAQRGHTKAQYYLGKLYEQGARGVEQDTSQAAHWLQLAAKGGCKEAKSAMLQLSRFINSRRTSTKVNANTLTPQTLHEKGESLYTSAATERDCESKAHQYQQASFFYDEAAKKGHKEAQYKLGLMYCNNVGVKRDVGYAIKLFTQAANLDHAGAQYALGKIYYEGQGAVFQDVSAAKKWFEESAKRGYVEAQLELAHIYSNLWSSFKNERRAIYWYNKAARQGKNVINDLLRINSPEALFVLGNICYCGHGVPKDDGWAYQHYENAARSGHEGAWKFIEQKAQSNPRAQVLLGKLIFHQNPQLAINLYKKAAQQNNHEAEFLLGEVYETGRGERKNIIEALSWYAKAAPDYYEAKHRIYTIAVRGSPEGHPEAQFIMGQLDYLDPNKNKREAANWFKKAAQQGHLTALFLLGTMCMKGEGVDQSPSQGAFYWRKASDQGHTDAQYYLGKLYITGQEGVFQDFSQGIHFLKKAASQGHEKALAELKLINRRPIALNKEKENVSLSVDPEELFKKAESVYAGATQEHDTHKREQLYKEARDLYVKLTKVKHAGAQFRLGLMYRDGIGGKSDLGYTRDLLTQSAEKGHMHAQYELGKIYNGGQGSISQDKNEAKRWYTKAAEQGHAAAQLELGHIYSNYWDPDKNIPQAIKWYFASAKQGNKDALSMLWTMPDSVEALFALGEIYEYGYGVDKNTSMALRNYGEAAKEGHQGALSILENKAQQGDPRSQIALGRLRYQKDSTRALKLYEAAAQQGDHEAEFLLGQEYEKGSLYEQDISKALHWYLKAASGYHEAKQRVYEIAGMGAPKGHPEAQFMMGQLTQLDPQKDRREVVGWFKKAADQQHLTSGLTEEESKVLMQILAEGAKSGDSAAQFSLGKLLERHVLDKETVKKLQEKEKIYRVIYIKAPFELAKIHLGDKSVDQSPSQAAYYFEKAAGQGHPEAQYNLANIYMNGARGVERSPGKGIDLLVKAAKQGHKDAQYAIGLEYIKGQNVKFNDIDAVEWWLKAGYQNHKDAQLNLSLMYKVGLGVLKDQRKSWSWLQKANHESVIGTIPINNKIEQDLSLKAHSLEIIEGVKHISTLCQSAQRDLIDNSSINTLHFFINSINVDNHNNSVIPPIYSSATEERDRDAQFILGIAHEFGLGFRKDSEQAIQWYLEAALQGHFKAQERLASLADYQERSVRRIWDWYQEFLAIKRNKREWLILKAQEGDLYSCYQLGQLHRYGWLTERNEKAAFEHFEQAAKKGYAPAQKALAEMYREGRGGVEASHYLAVKWYSRAGKQGDAGASAAIKEIADEENVLEAVYGLAKAHEEGWGIARDEEEALTLYSQAARQGYGKAQYVSAVKILEGKLSSDEDLEPLMLLTTLAGRKAREKYLEVIGKEPNRKERKALRRLSEQGYYKAQHKLAELYEKGSFFSLSTLGDTLKAYQEAIRLYEAAMKSNKPVALAPLERVRASLERLQQMTEEDKLKENHPGFAAFLETVGEAKEYAPHFLRELAFVFDQADLYGGEVKEKMLEMMQSLARLSAKKKQAHSLLQQMTVLVSTKAFKEEGSRAEKKGVEAYRLKELSILEKDLALIRRSWTLLPLPSECPSSLKIARSLLHDPRIELFNSYFTFAENAYDPELFQRSVDKIMHLFGQLRKEQYIKEDSFYSEDDAKAGTRETLEKLITHNHKPTNRFAHRLICIADIVYERSRKDPSLVADQLIQWAKRGLNCLTASEEEMNRFYIDTITNTKSDSEALAKEDYTLELQVALSLAKLRYQLLDEIVEKVDEKKDKQANEQRIHAVKCLEKKARWALGLLGDAEKYSDPSAYEIPQHYQQMTTDDIVISVLERYTPDRIAKHIAKQIDEKVIDYDKIGRRLRFQFLRSKVAPHGEFDSSLFESEDYLLDHCTREEFDRYSLPLHLRQSHNPNTNNTQSITFDWEVLKGQAYDKAREQRAEFYDEDIIHFTPQGAKALLHGMGYLEIE